MHVGFLGTVSASQQKTACGIYFFFSLQTKRTRPCKTQISCSYITKAKLKIKFLGFTDYMDKRFYGVWSCGRKCCTITKRSN